MACISFCSVSLQFPERGDDGRRLSELLASSPEKKFYLGNFLSSNFYLGNKWLAKMMPPIIFSFSYLFSIYLVRYIRQM